MVGSAEAAQVSGQRQSDHFRDASGRLTGGETTHAKGTINGTPQWHRPHGDQHGEREMHDGRAFSAAKEAEAAGN
jgi:hypothetical protein